MFQCIGKMVARYWPVVLVFWAALLASGWLFAPAWEKVTQAGEVNFLPSDTPSRRGDRLFREAFPEEYSGSNVALLLRRAEAGLTEQDRRFIEELTVRLDKLTEDQGDKEPLISAIRSPDSQGTGALLVSPDGQAALVVLELRTSVADPQNPAVVAQVEEILAGLKSEGATPEGLEVGVTGSATAGRDLFEAERQSVMAIEIWTVIVVVALLLLLYRAPLATVIPLVTVFVAVRVSIQLLSLLAGFGLMTPDRDVRIFITVLAYGAGVDYCLFLISRYREELAKGAEPGRAIADAVGQVGETVVASAATVIFGVGMLAFASFGKIQQAGLTIPLAIAVVLFATITLTPAMLRAVGRAAFWPRLIDDEEPHMLAGILGNRRIPDVWAALGQPLLRRPGTILLVCFALLSPFAGLAVWRYTDQNFNPLEDLPADAPSAATAKAAAEHFPIGALGPVTVLLQHDEVHFGTREGRESIARLSNRLAERCDELCIADARSVARPLGQSPAAAKALADLPSSNVREQAIRHYVSQEGDHAGHVTRLDLTLCVEPLSRDALAQMDQIEAHIRSSLPEELRDARIEISGVTASARDLAVVKKSDEVLIQILVPVVVLVVLLVILRKVTISLYLVMSVQFSYLVTLGATFAVFWLLNGAEFTGLDWKVPIFLFTILVAVGEDYNILLIGRAREEQERYGPLRGITAALARTGRVISACGIIMAGTFASLMSGSLMAMKQLGFALALGILLDTLVVRPVLVPAFLILLQKGVFGPLGRSVALTPERIPHGLQARLASAEKGEEAVAKR